MKPREVTVGRTLQGAKGVEPRPRATVGVGGRTVPAQRGPEGSHVLRGGPEFIQLAGWDVPSEVRLKIHVDFPEQGVHRAE